MNTKLNFGFQYRKKTLRKNTFKLNRIFWNKQLRPALNNSEVHTQPDLGWKWRFRVYSYFKSSFKSSQVNLFPETEVSLGWPRQSSEDAWIAKFLGHSSTFPWHLASAAVSDFLWKAIRAYTTALLPAFSSLKRKTSSFKLAVTAPALEKFINPSSPPHWFPSWSSAGSGSLNNIRFRNK